MQHSGKVRQWKQSDQCVNDVLPSMGKVFDKSIKVKCCKKMTNGQRARYGHSFFGS